MALQYPRSGRWRMSSTTIVPYSILVKCCCSSSAAPRLCSPMRIVHFHSSSRSRRLVGGSQGHAGDERCGKLDRVGDMGKGMVPGAGEGDRRDQ